MARRFLTGVAGAVGLVVAVPTAVAQVTLPHTFEGGQPALADEVNVNFQTLVDAINDLGTDVGGPDFVVSGSYFLVPSASGASGERNVIVYDDKRVDDGSGACHVARMFYSNTEGETMKNAEGVDIVPDNLWKWISACDPDRLLIYTYGIPDSVAGSAWTETDGVNILEQSGGTMTIDQAYNFRQLGRFSALGSSDLSHNMEWYRDAAGETVAITSWSSLRTPIDEQVTVNGMTFEDVAIDSTPAIARERLRVNGLGMVQEVLHATGDPAFPGNMRIRKVVYYRNDTFGTAGSLEGTPFGPGGFAEGLL